MKPVPQGADQTGRLPTPAALSRTGRRLRLVTWNTGGLSSTVYREVLTWLQEEHQAYRTVDICILQETAWREDMEFTTTPVGPGSLTWHAVHSAGGDRTGILCLVRAGLLNPTHIRTAALVPGRLVHLRLLFEVPLDILCIYQFAWNLQKVELRGAKNKTDAMLRQRRQIWQHVDKWIRAIPQRNGCVVLGDFNVSVGRTTHVRCRPTTIHQCCPSGSRRATGNLTSTQMHSPQHMVSPGPSQQDIPLSACWRTARDSD